jgi:uncharacterized protein (TIGR02145 family)
MNKILQNKFFALETICFLCLSLILCVACSSDSSAGGSTEDETIVALKDKTITGVSQKGPFVKGSSVTVQELDGETFAQTGKSFKGKIISDAGDFKLDIKSLISQYVLIEANGYFFNEITGGKSNAPITLNAFSNIKERDNVNINLLTHLAYERTLYLVTKEDMPFSKAKKQAEQEVLKSFGIEEEFNDAEELNIFGTENANAALLAISILMQKDLFEGDEQEAGLSERLTNYSLDIETDGIWNDIEIQTKIADGVSFYTLEEHKARYTENIAQWGISTEIPAFEKYIGVFWWTNYGLGACNAENEGEVKQNINELSEKFQKYYVCKNEIWQVAESKDLYGAGVVGQDIEYGEMIDTRDGKAYKTIQIGSQTWMAENLNYETENSYCYENDPANCEKYGRLYPSAALLNACPEGYHLPTAEEFATLISNVGGKEIAGKMLKSIAGWYDYELSGTGVYNDGNGIDKYGFNALPGGSGIGGIGVNSSFWSVRGNYEDNSLYGFDPDSYYSLELASSSQWAGLADPYEGACMDYDDWSCALSVRCLLGESSKSVEKGTFIDSRDAKTYQTVKIGNQEWMAENLNYETENSYCYNDSTENCKKYGRLYTWEAALNACPSGWHLPTIEEFETLISNFGGKEYAGKKLKSLTGWNGVDKYGFNVLPAGSRGLDGRFSYAGMLANFWSATATESDESYARELYLNSSDEEAYLSHSDEDNAYSVRCLLGKSPISSSSSSISSSSSSESVEKGTFIDSRDAKTYQTVKIGNQEWMAENLNYETENSYCYKDSTENCKKYGRLYTWEAALNACPEGYHLPTEEEFATLISNVGGKETAGKMLKSTTGWYEDGHGVDKYGFNVLPAGGRYGDGDFDYAGTSALFWSATEGGEDYAYILALNYSYEGGYLKSANMDVANPVRCLRD